jgi:hypothetical protein
MVKFSYEGLNMSAATLKPQRSFSMKKNIVSFLGILTMALVFGLAVVGCESDDDNGSNSNSGNNSGNNNNDSNGNDSNGNNNGNNNSGNNSGDSNSGGGVPSELVGKWYDANGDEYFEITSSKFRFKETTETGTEKIWEADISVSGGTITLKDENNNTESFKYSISGGKMTISNGTGPLEDIGTATLTKK